LTDLGFEKTRPIRAGSTLFVCIGSTIGKVAQNSEECATNQQINAVIPSKSFSDAFVFYCLLKHSKTIAGFAGKPKGARFLLTSMTN
jgi:type I restriction enzyme S subunit